EEFHPDRMARRILDVGDVLTLIERAQQAVDEEEAKKVADKLAKEAFTPDDFLEQMQQRKKMGSVKRMLAMLAGMDGQTQKQLKKMGSMKKMLGMLPGMGGQMKQQLENFDDSEIGRTEAIIRGMTPAERQNTKILNGSRRARIARGSGVTVTEVNQLVNRFEQAAKMMKKVARGENAGIPGMGAMPGVKPGASSKRAKKGKKGKFQA